MKKRVVIYGFNGACKDVALSLDDEFYEVVGVIDDKECTHGQKLLLENYEVEVVAPNELYKYDYDYVIVSPYWYHVPMEKKLREEFGIDSTKIVLWDAVGELNKVDRRIAQFRLCIEQIKNRNVEGACAEVGVYKGEFAKYINRYLSDRKLYLFDTFEGFVSPELTSEEKKDVPQVFLDSYGDTSIDYVVGKMTKKSNIVIRKGYFPNTIQEEEKKESFAFVSLDTDLYNPIKDGLEFFYPRLSQGGYIFVHDYGSSETPGVKKAVDEFCMDKEVSMFPILDRCLSIAITK